VTLKKCASGSICFPLQRQEYLRKTKQEMLYEYQKWQTKETAEEDEEASLCCPKTAVYIRIHCV